MKVKRRNDLGSIRMGIDQMALGLAQWTWYHPRTVCRFHRRRSVQALAYLQPGT